MNGFPHNIVSYGRQVASGAKQIKNLRLSLIRKVFSLMGKREKIALSLLFLLALGSLFISLKNSYLRHTSLVPANGGIYSEGMLGQPNYINPLLAHQETDLGLIKIIFSGLYEHNNDGQLVPDLAEALPEISEDQKQYTINLKRNVKWHNDKPFTADDVVFTIQTLQDPAYKSPLRQQWLSTTVEKLGDYSIKFTTKDISGPFIHNLTLPILPQSVWNKVEPQNFVLTNANLQAIGTGPYSIKEIKKLASGKIQSLGLESFSNYYGGKPKLDTVNIKFFDTEEDLLNALHSKEINGFGFVALGSNLYLDPAQEDFNIFNLPLPQYQVLFFNLKNKFLSDRNVRLALALAVDKKTIVEQVFKNNALVPISPLFPEAVAEANKIEFNVDQAKKLLDMSGWLVDGNTQIRTKKNQQLEISIATNDLLVNSKIAESVAQSWRLLNIKVNLNILPTKELTDNLIKPRSFDVLLFPQKLGPDPDLFAFWHSSQAKDPGLNLTGFSSPAVDKLITEARATTNPEIRQAKYQELNKLITDSVAAVYLSQTQYIYALNKEIKNVGLKTLNEPGQRFYDLPNWYVAEKRVWK